jgi:hypothetical protein
MTWVVITCPRCDDISRLPAQALLLEVEGSGGRTDEAGGAVTWACAACLGLVSRTLQEADIVRLVAAGVATIDERSFEPVEPLPPSAAWAATLTYDDLLDLHQLMARSDWLNEVMTGAGASNTKGFPGPSGPPHPASW